MMKLRLITMKDMPSAAKQAAWGGGAATRVLRVQQQPNQHINGWSGWVGGGSYQDLRSGAHGFFVFGNNTDVEDSGENENEAGSWGGAWKDTKKLHQTDLQDGFSIDWNLSGRLVLKH